MEGKIEKNNKKIRSWTPKEREILRNIWSKNLLIGIKQTEEVSLQKIKPEITVLSKQDYPTTSGNN